MSLKKKPVTPEQACLRLAGLCSRSEQCEADLLRKLVNMGLNRAQQREVMNYLKEERYVDNLRYAKSFASDKARFSGWGPYKIKGALTIKRIPEKYVKEALETIPADIWQESLMRCAAAKVKTLSPEGLDDRENRVKLYRYLLSRGFSSAQSVKAVQTMRRQQREDS